MALSPGSLRAIRLRLRDDFAFYCESAIKIRKKNQKIETMTLNKAQRALLEVIDRQLENRGYVRIIVLKGRQMGISTEIGAWLYWWVSQRTGQKALVVAHKSESTQTLFDMTRRFHDNMVDILKPNTRYSSRKELSFGVLDSSYAIVTAGGDGIVRSETITAAHLSELAFWPKGSAKDNFSGLMDAVPTERGTAVFIESTANGMHGVFYEQCRAAQNKEGAFEFVFLPWFWDDGYRSKPTPGFTPTPEEERLMENYGLDFEQLAFRRIKIAEKGVDLFKQEYPCNAEEAFLTSGRPVFNPEETQRMMDECQEPIRLMALETVVDDDNKIDWKWEESPIGELAVYREFDPAETYYIGADVGLGVGKDYSVAVVLDSHRNQVAIWRSDQYAPDRFGKILAHLGRAYSDAMICCERNNHGILTNRVIHNDEQYPHVYTEMVLDKISDAETEQLGFLTTQKTKPLVINKLRAIIRDREITIPDIDTIRELQQFTVSTSGKMEAESGTNDDIVIALALANHINEGPWKPIKNQENWYLEL